MTKQLGRRKKKTAKREKGNGLKIHLNQDSDASVLDVPAT
jgi:hypothetical protein